MCVHYIQKSLGFLFPDKFKAQLRFTERSEILSSKLGLDLYGKGPAYLFTLKPCKTCKFFIVFCMKNSESMWLRLHFTMNIWACSNSTDHNKTQRARTPPGFEQ